MLHFEVELEVAYELFCGLIIMLVWLVVSLHKLFVLAKFYCCVCVCVCVCVRVCACARVRVSLTINSGGYADLHH